MAVTTECPESMTKYGAHLWGAATIDPDEPGPTTYVQTCVLCGARRTMEDGCPSAHTTVRRHELVDLVCIRPIPVDLFDQLRAIVMGDGG